MAAGGGTETTSVSVDRGRFWVGIALVAGFGLGLFSVLADGVVPVRAVVTLGNIIAPWAVVAFVVGRVAATPKRGAAAGALALVVGVTIYYLGQAVRSAAVADEPVSAYLASPIPFVWALAAITVGPVMGLAGAIVRHAERPPIAAVVALPVVLVAEAGFLFVDRRPWLWNLGRETYRLADLAIMVGLPALAAALTVTSTREPERRRMAFALILGAGAAGGVLIVGLYRLIVALA